MEIVNTNFRHVLIIGVAIINIFSCIVMALDKSRALQGKNDKRIPEGVMFFLASIFGGLGVYLGMFIFRHKIRKWYFQVGIPLLIFQNIVVLYSFLEMMV